MRLFLSPHGFAADFFDPRDCDYSEHMKRGGQRVFTVFVYLNQVEGGGTTSFPNLKVSMKPVEGRAVFWSNQRASDGQMDPRMLHSGDPVTSGEKFGMNMCGRRPALASLSPSSACSSAGPQRKRRPGEAASRSAAAACRC